MKILNWNVKVARRKGSQNQLRILIKTYDQDILTLIENKINLDRALSLIPQLEFPNFRIIRSESFSREIGCFRKIHWVSY